MSCIPFKLAKKINSCPIKIVLDAVMEVDTDYTGVFINESTGYKILINTTSSNAGVVEFTGFPDNFFSENYTYRFILILQGQSIDSPIEMQFDYDLTAWSLLFQVYKSFDTDGLIISSLEETLTVDLSCECTD